MTPELLFVMYLRLDTCSRSDEVDPGVFRLHHDDYAKNYQRLSLQQQGEVCAMINEHFHGR